MSVLTDLLRDRVDDGASATVTVTCPRGTITEYNSCPGGITVGADGYVTIVADRQAHA